MTALDRTLRMGRIPRISSSGDKGRRCAAFPIVVVCAVVLVAACMGELRAPAGLAPIPSTVSANIDGVAWSATEVITSTIGTTTRVSAWDNTGLRLILTVLTDQGAGSQSVGFTSSTGAFWREGTQYWSALGNVGIGSVSLTALTANRLTGSFTFTLQASLPGASPPSRQITSGQFDVSF